MKGDIENFLEKINGQKNPLIIADKLSIFIANALRKGEISLYEAYLLNFEEARFRRTGYIQSSWNEKVQISTCLAILNQKLLAHIFDEKKGAETLKKWGLEAYRLNNEKRSHYIMDRYLSFLDAHESPELLQELIEIRHQYDELSFDEGPYHNEVFPYDYYSPEEIILGDIDKQKVTKGLKEDIEQLIIDLSI